MKLLKEIFERDLGLSEGDNVDRDSYAIRTAARAIVFDNDLNIALLEVRDYFFYKLPGGGVEEDEHLEEALCREVKEETGCDIKVEKEIGKIIEYLDKTNIKQTSYGYAAKVKGEKGRPTFTEQEKAAGFLLRWVPLEEAVRLMKKDTPELYYGKFIQHRDLVFLQAFLAKQKKQRTVVCL